MPMTEMRVGDQTIRYHRDASGLSGSFRALREQLTISITGLLPLALILLRFAADRG
jgi:hypothetical protein